MREMGYNDAVNYLYGLQKYGIKLGLEKPFRILSLLGNPQLGFRAVHVAGTNGKGSTSAFIASILKNSGFNTGLFTSPHLVSFTERIRVNNEEITESDVVALTEEIRAAIDNSKLVPTFFEFVTAMAFLYFRMKKVDWAVIEVGMGGRLDATNIIVPEVSVIARINYDHGEFLGSTLTEIAGEKAGIIKKGVPVVSAMQDREAGHIIENTAKEKSSPLFTFGRDFNGRLISSDIQGITFDYLDGRSSIEGLHTQLAGDHQLINACLAIKAVLVAANRSKEQEGGSLEERKISDTVLRPWHFSLLAAKKGLASVKWPGRLELMNTDPLIIIDGAHNADASRTLSEFVKKHLSAYKIVLVLGIMSDKDIKGIMNPLLPLAFSIIMTAPAYGRAARPSELAREAAALGFTNVHEAVTVKAAIGMAMETGLRIKGGGLEEDKSLPLILITGSFYTIGEAKEALGNKGVLSRLRE